MGRLAELFVLLAAISTIATFFGFRALARKAVRSLGRKPEEHKDPPATIAFPEELPDRYERRTESDVHSRPDAR